MDMRISNAVEDSKAKEQQKKEDEEIESHLKLIQEIQEIVKNQDSEETVEVQSNDFKFNGLFRLLENIQEVLTIEKRSQCLIQNLLQRRKENWVESVYTEKGPKTMGEIYEDHTKRNQPKEENKRLEPYSKPVVLDSIQK